MAVVKVRARDHGPASSCIYIKLHAVFQNIFPEQLTITVSFLTGYTRFQARRIPNIRPAHKQAANMVQIDPFTVEQWMDKYELTPGVLNISETCASSISINELIKLSTDENAKTPFDPDDKMTYGAIKGSQQLREYVASLCSGEDGPKLSADNVLIAQGAIHANFLAMYTLVGPGDHVICVYPTYQQLYSVPPSLGAETSLWKLRHENGYVPDLAELEGLVKENTKVRQCIRILRASIRG